MNYYKIQLIYVQYLSRFKSSSSNNVLYINTCWNGWYCSKYW